LWGNVLSDIKLGELVFQHFSFADVIKVSSVSKLSYSSTASSNKCMEKLQINVGKDDKNLDDLTTSQRNYRNLKLHSFSSRVIEYLVKHKWSRLNLLIGSITDKNFLQLLNIVAPTITEIEFYLENVITDEVLPVVNFPLLETIVIRWTDTRVLEPFFGENENLKNVVIELKQSGAQENVKKFLCKNKSIKNLSMRLCHEDLLDFFDEDFTDKHQLQMEILAFYWRNTLFVERRVIRNLEKFIVSQKDCLQRLVYEGTFNTKSVLELIVNEMKSLTHLTLVDVDPVLTQEGDYNFQPNESIQQIDVCVNWFVFDRVFEELVKATTNLEVLYIIELTLDTMKFLAENAKNLRHLIYEEIEEDCEEYYNNLILGSDGDDVVNSLIQISWEQDFEIDYPEIHSKLQFT
jgi:hypothetical protein